MNKDTAQAHAVSAMEALKRNTPAGALCRYEGSPLLPDGGRAEEIVVVVREVVGRVRRLCRA